MPILQSLEEIKTWTDRKASSTADQLLAALIGSSFAISLAVMNHVLALTLPLSKSLQAVGQDLVKCTQEVNLTLATIQQCRSNPEQSFSEVYQDASQFLGESLTVPRITGSQKNRCNVPSADPQEYYPRTVWIPFLDQLITRFNEQFDSHQTTAIKLSCLIPQFIEKYSFDDLLESLELYGKFLNPSVSTIAQQYQRSIRKWFTAPKSARPANAIDALAVCDPAFFPDIVVLLQIFATLPVTSATPERSFSALRRLKTYLRNTMGEDRLNGLAMMHIHKETEINIDKVIDSFAAKKRRVSFADN